MIRLERSRIFDLMDEGCYADIRELSAHMLLES
jgi:hypothetical protein